MLKGRYYQNPVKRFADEIYIFDDRENITVKIDVTFTKHNGDIKGFELEPTLSLQRDDDFNGKEFLVALSEALQEMGIYPENPEVKEIKATKYHLEDMRKIALNL